MTSIMRSYICILIFCLYILGTYYAAVIENRVDFHGRVVVDVGAGSGILSLFAAQVCLNIRVKLFKLFDNKKFRFF